ncbi:hypothetical protein HK096_004368, partial [Nowakowskiella sp. JEL0078]
MGKINNKKSKRKNNEKQNTSSPQNPITSSSSSTAFLQVLQNLESEDLNTVSWSAVSLSHFAKNDSDRTVLVKYNVIGLLASKLNIANEQIALSIATAIKNFCLYGGEEISKEFLNKGLLGSIFSWFPALSDKFPKMFLTPTEESQHSQALLDQLLSILVVLCESLSQTIQTLSTSILPNYLPALLTPLSPLTPTVLQLLYHVTDEAKFFNRIAKPNEILITLGQLASETNYDRFARVHAAATLYNLRNELAVEKFGFSQLWQTVVNASIAASQWDHDLQGEVVKLRDLVGSVTSNSDQIASTVQREMKLAKREAGEDSILQELHTIVFALELLANVFSEDSKWDDAIDFQNSGMEVEVEEDDEFEMEILDEDMEEVMDQEELTKKKVLNPADIIPGVIGLTHVNLLSAELNSTGDEDFAKTISKLNATLVAVRLRALGCLSNLLMAVDSVWASSKAADLKSLWDTAYLEAQSMCQVAVEKKVTNSDASVEFEAVESWISIMWAVSRVLDSVGDLSLKITSTEIQTIGLIQACTNPYIPDSIKIRCISIFSIIGKLQNQISQNRMIGEYLMLTIEQAPSLELISEALNAVYDVYADKIFDYDSPVF